MRGNCSLPSSVVKTFFFPTLDPPGHVQDIGEYIREQLDKVENDANLLQPFDDLRNYAYEGCGSPAGSLSSLASGIDDNEQDFDYLSQWGPRFHNLARMYHHSGEE